MTVQTAIENKIVEAFDPVHYQVFNESFMHSVPPNSETHFKVVVVSGAFDGKRSVGRHQLVYKLLAQEIAGPVHALSLHTYTEEEWLKLGSDVPNSPDCMGKNKIP